MPIYARAWVLFILIILAFGWATSCGTDGADVPELTEEQQIENAYEIAKECLNTEDTIYSRQALIDELRSKHDYTLAISEEAVDKLEENEEVDWYLQAERAGMIYIEREPLSEEGLVDKLAQDDGFDLAEAYEAAYQLWSKGEVDWEENAAEVARSLLESDDYDRDELIYILTGEAYQFTPKEAEAAANSI